MREERLELEEGDELVEGPPVVGGRDAVDRPVELEGVRGGDVPDELVALPHDQRDLPQERPVPLPGDVGQDRELAGRRVEEPREHLQGRRLARAVRAEEADDLPRREVEGDAVHGADLGLAAMDEARQGGPEARLALVTTYVFFRSRRRMTGAASTAPV